MSEFEIDAESAADIAKFEVQLSRYLSGELDEDVFRVFRLNNGVYGQRQGGHNQMIRIKAPFGTITAAQLDRMADLSTEYSRGWGHLTTDRTLAARVLPPTSDVAIAHEGATTSRIGAMCCTCSASNED